MMKLLNFSYLDCLYATYMLLGLIFRSCDTNITKFIDFIM